MRHFFLFNRVNRGLMALAITLALGMVSGGFATSAMAQEPGADVNAVMICPPDLGNDEIAPDDCTEPAAGIEFYIANPNTDNVEFGTTGGDGMVSFPLDKFAISPEGAQVEIGALIDSNPHGAITGHLVGCTQNGESLSPDTINTVINPGGTALAVQLTVAEGDQVSCEWFLSHHSGEAGEEGGDESASELPRTGSGAALEPTGNHSALVLGGALASVLTGGAAIVIRRSHTYSG